MSLNKGDIVLVPFHFTDLTSTKLRPAIILWARTSSPDVTLCFISSQNLTNLNPEEFLINKTDSEFSNTGLKTTSKVRVSRIITLEKRLLLRKIGSLGKNYIQLLNQALVTTFQLEK